MTHPVRSAFDADDRFSAKLREHYGERACEMRYRPTRWPADVTAAWMESQEAWGRALQFLAQGDPNSHWAKAERMRVDATRSRGDGSR